MYANQDTHCLKVNVIQMLGACIICIGSRATIPGGNLGNIGLLIRGSVFADEMDGKVKLEQKSAFISTTTHKILVLSLRYS